MNYKVFNLSQLLVRLNMYNWDCKELKFIPTEWNEFYYTDTPYSWLVITLKLKIINDEVFVQYSWDKKIYKAKFYDLEVLINKDEDIYLIINKKVKEKKELDQIQKDFE